MSRKPRRENIRNRDYTDFMLWTLAAMLVVVMVFCGILSDRSFTLRQDLVKQRVNFQQTLDMERIATDKKIDTLDMERIATDKKIDTLRWDAIQYDLEDRTTSDGVHDVLFARVRDMDLDLNLMSDVYSALMMDVADQLHALEDAQPEPWAASYQQMQDSTVWITTMERDASGKGPAGWGSGVFIADNKIMTAHHVATHIDLVVQNMVVTYKGAEYRITGVHLDPNSDLATIDTEEIKEGFIPELLKRDITLGDTVVVIGTPMTEDLHLRVSQGIVSHLDRGDDSGQYHGWSVLVGTDATAGPGNSGGPVFIEGRLAALLVGGYGGNVGPLSLILPISEFD